MRWIMKLTGYTLLAAIFALCLITVPPQIESDLLAKIQKNLQENQIGWAMVSINGRDITLSGSPPDSVTAQRAARIAGQTPGVHRIETAWGDSTDAAATPPSPNSTANVDIAAMETTRHVPVRGSSREDSQLSITLPTQSGINYEIEE